MFSIIFCEFKFILFEFDKFTICELILQIFCLKTIDHLYIIHLIRSNEIILNLTRVHYYRIIYRVIENFFFVYIELILRISQK